MWEMIPGLVEKLVSHGRLPFAAFVTCVWVLYRRSMGSPLDFNDNTTYFQLGLVFSGSLIAAQISAWVHSKAVGQLAAHQCKTAERRRLEAEEKLSADREKQEQEEILKLLDTLSDTQAIALHYARITNQQRFQAYEWDDALWSMHMMKLVRKGVDTEGDNALWEVPDFVWNAIRVDEIPDDLKTKIKSRGAPWKTKRQHELRGYRV